MYIDIRFCVLLLTFSLLGKTEAMQKVILSKIADLSKNQKPKNPIVKALKGVLTKNYFVSGRKSL